MTNTATLIASVPASIFSIDDFRDFKVERDLPELTYDEYKGLRAAEYADTHQLGTTDNDVDALVEKELEEIDGAVDEVIRELSDPQPIDAEESAPKAEKPVPASRKKVAKKVVKKVVKKADSKKARTVAIYNEVMAAGGSRKDGIARLTSELELSTAGASTYWQNVKSGKWA